MDARHSRSGGHRRRVAAGTLALCLVAPAGYAGSGPTPQRPQAGAAGRDPDMQEIRGYRLTMGAVQQFVAASQAVTASPAVKTCMDKSRPGNAPTLTEGERRIAACPGATALLQSHGLKPREYLLLMTHVVGDVTAVAMKRAGNISSYPDTLSPENAAFVEQNFDKLQAMLGQLGGATSSRPRRRS
jgi:hypothetical protein